MALENGVFHLRARNWGGKLCSCIIKDGGRFPVNGQGPTQGVGLRTFDLEIQYSRGIIIIDLNYFTVQYTASAIRKF